MVFYTYHYCIFHLFASLLLFYFFTFLPTLVLFQKGFTLLHFAALNGHLNVVQALVKEMGLDPRATDKVRGS